MKHFLLLSLALLLFSATSATATDILPNQAAQKHNIAMVEHESAAANKAGHMRPLLIFGAIGSLLLVAACLPKSVISQLHRESKPADYGTVATTVDSDPKKTVELSATGSTHFNNFMLRVFDWTALGLTVTGAVAYLVVYLHPEVLIYLQQHAWVLVALFIFELVIVCFISVMVVSQSITLFPALTMYIVYCILNGIVLAPIFAIYTAGSIYTAFLTTALVFIVMSLYGYYTKEDLTTIGNLCFIALVGIIVAGLVNWFIQSPVINYIISIITVLIFTILIAFDVQKFKQLSQGREDDNNSSLPVLGALSLYLDFINIFLALLQLFGEKK